MEPKIYIKSLTGIRALAAFMVFAHHQALPGQHNILKSIFGEFHVGVTLFYVLSGFLITVRYYETKDYSKRWFLDYLKNRVARIYPMYIILTVLTFFAIYGIPGNILWYKTLFMNITFLRGFFHDYLFTGITQGWSLTVEECFYFLAPVIFILHRNKNTRLVTLLISAWIIGILLFLSFRNVYFSGFFKPLKMVIQFTFFGRAFEFFAGIYLAFLFLKNIRLRSWISNIPAKTYSGLVLFILLIFIMSRFQDAETIGYSHPVGLIINNLILPVSIVIMFYGLITEKTFFRKVLETRTFDLLGKSSYVFYLIHIGFIADFLFHWVSSYVIVNFILLNLISVALFVFVESPLQRGIKKLRFYRS